MENGENPYRPIESQVLEVCRETPTICTLRLKPSEYVGFQPGQFIELSIPGVGEAPFTPSSHWLDSEALDVTVMRVGRVTNEIHRLQTGDTVGVRGPFGKGYALDEFHDKQVLVVGGGCGFAPLRSLMYALFDISDKLESLTFRGGCRSPSELVYRSELQGWFDRKDLDMQLTVDQPDPGWEGPVGVVTTILEELPLDPAEAIAIVCGPPVMMKFATRKLVSVGFADSRLYLSMEKNMSCGFGKCGHCRLGTFYCCKDGPVFRYSEIKDYPGIWE